MLRPNWTPVGRKRTRTGRGALRKFSRAGTTVRREKASVYHEFRPVVGPPRGGIGPREGEDVGVADLLASRRCQCSLGHGATGLSGARAPLLSADPRFVATSC